MILSVRKNSVYNFTIGDFLMYAFITIFALVCVVPFALSVVVSVSVEDSIITKGYSFLPTAFTFRAYQTIFASGSNVKTAYFISCLVTVIGTAGAVFITIMAAFALANKNVQYRDEISLFFFVTMMFNTGLVPWYLMCKGLGLYNNFAALIIPSLIFSPFNLFLCRNFMKGIPSSLHESAVMDGANDIYIALIIYVPLSTPIIATVSLFYGLAYWNDWWNAIMLVENRDLYPIQYFLLQLRSRINMINDLRSNYGGAQIRDTLPAESVKMATSIITIGPIVLMYPLLQRYFVSGLTIGAIKG